MCRIANEVIKESKNDTAANLKKLFSMMKLREAFDESAMVQNRMA